MFKKRILFLFVLLLFTSNAFSQHEHHTPPAQKEVKDMEHMQHEENPASSFLMSQGAGTAVNPLSSGMTMSMKKLGNWNLMTHGYVFLNFIEQSGDLGDDEFFSTNHLMLMAERPLSERSTLLIRGMLSLEPGTIQDGFYPLLFQTGETADAEPIRNGQHPHDLFMELSAQYAIQLNENVLLHLYAGLRGDPALGPVAFPHRISAQELPQATLSHHLQDSTHIADDVLTAGVQFKKIRLEFSGFHGAEPDEHRWDLDQGAIDSWSTRINFTPNARWAAQISTGRLKQPEELEPGDIHRTTASATYDLPTATGHWASSVIWGWNHKIEDDLNVHSFLYETLLQFNHKNYLTGRFEVVDKEELFEHDSPLAGEVFRVKALTVGYARDFDLIPQLQTGIGANFTFYAMPSELDPIYGNSPKGVFFYFRIRGGSHGH